MKISILNTIHVYASYMYTSTVFGIYGFLINIIHFLGALSVLIQKCAFNMIMKSLKIHNDYINLSVIYSSN